MAADLPLVTATPEPAENPSAVAGFLTRGGYSRAFSLCGLALTNYFLFYVTNIQLARRLSLSDFDDYSVAVSIVTILSTVATLGLEKYALRCLPVYRERRNWRYAAGYWRFSLRTIISFSIGLVLLLSISLEMVLVSRHADSHLAVIIVAGFLPVITAVLYLVEVATATGAQIPAVVIYRFLLPACLFVLVQLTDQFGLSSTAISAAICYGIAWVLALVAVGHLVGDSMPQEVWHAEPSMLRRKWLRRSAPFLFNSWMLSMMASSGVIMLEIFFTSQSVVGTFAVATQTGTFIVLLANTTNRFYLPLMSLSMERHDKASMRHLMRHRFMVIGTLTLLFVTGVVLIGEDILGWFGPNYRDGYASLCVLALGASVNALFSDAPYYLQFMKSEGKVFLTTAIAVVVNLTLTGLLGYRYGALGAALGYSASMSLLFVTQRLLASRQFIRHFSIPGGAILPGR